MVTLRQYLENIDLGLDDDIASLIDPRVDEIESTVCALPIVYKYYSANRRRFFHSPQVRFTQHAELNDPFEFSRRWQSESFIDARPKLMGKVQKGVSTVLSNVEFVSEALQEEFKGNGIELSPPQMDLLKQLLQTPEGQEFLRLGQEASAAKLGPMMDYVIKTLEERLQQQLQGLIAQWGIFSISESPINQQMWSHYSENGAGFVVGFDAQHDFFFSTATPRRNLLRKVVYSDERVTNFWRNPYFLFLVKNSGWSYEREWRMMKELVECSEHLIVDGKDIFLCNVPRGVIKEIYFGYAYDASKIESDANEFYRDGCETKFYKVDANRITGQLEPQLIKMPQK
jgi:Protein of unknown function (DUF2971)